MKANGSLLASLVTLFLATGLSLSAQAEGKRLLVVMKEQGNLKAASATVARAGQIEESLDNINSLVVSVNDDAALARLRANPAVALVEEEVFHPAPKLSRPLALPVERSIEKAIPRYGSFQAGPKTPWGILAVKAIEAWGPSNAGANARVLVLDTGIDKDHPSLAANFEKGQDFVGDNLQPYPFADKIGHGTHCAGTIAGVADASGFTGVAPRAKILAGRVCSAQGCSNISIAKGVNWGIAERVDVISMSLGGAWSTPAERDAIAKADAAGITVVAAAGNDGTSRVSYPAALPQVIAVGAVDSKLVRTSFSQYGPELAVVAPGANVVSTVPQGTGREADVQVSLNGAAAQRVVSTTFEGAAEVPVPVDNVLAFAGLGKAADFATANVQGKFALLSRGEITFKEKVDNAMKAGAAGVIVYNNEPGLIHGALTQDGSRIAIPVFMVEQQVGEAMRQAIAANQVVRARVVVLATDYSPLDGTSMATPHVAGVVALVKSTNKTIKPADVKALLKRTAQALGPNANNEYGAGIVNAQAAVSAAAGANFGPRMAAGF